MSELDSLKEEVRELTNIMLWHEERMSFLLTRLAGGALGEVNAILDAYSTHFPHPDEIECDSDLPFRVSSMDLLDCTGSI
jgi:hypothetical protein